MDETFTTGKKTEERPTDILMSPRRMSAEFRSIRKKMTPSNLEMSEIIALNRKTRDIPVGILRSPRRLSAEFRPAQGEPTSPQPSVDRFSVTFAEDSIKSDSSSKGSKCNYFNPSLAKMDKVNFPSDPTEGEGSDQEDYSASVNAIILKRASTRRRSRRKNGRRGSSPFSPDVLGNGRRSSVYTTSSGDTAITMDENIAAEATQEEIFENIKLHKEVLSNVKMQPWNMRKKLKLVVQAKAYIKKHEGVLQERLAQSHSTKDMLATWNIYLIRKWQHWRREILNLSMWLIPWESKIKEIESHFGSVVASYFIFLRWLFWVNLVIAVVIISFVAIPEIITPTGKSDDRKHILDEEKYNATNFLTLWDFEGVFKYSPLFYGWYTNDDPNNRGYRLPFAYFITGLVVYAYSFFATLRKMAENSRMSKLSEKDDECIFSWKLFTAWDYMIGNTETAQNRLASIVMGFKEALLEEAEKKREARKWKIIGFRALVNTIVLGLLTFSAFAVIKVVQRSTEKEANSTVWRKNEITIVMSLITLLFPMLFEVLGLVEQYHPRKQLRLQLARIMVLNLLNLYSLIIALFGKISYMTSEQHNFRNIVCAESRDLVHTSDHDSNIINYANDNKNTENIVSANLVSELAYNISNAVYPNVMQLIKGLIMNATSELTASNNSLYDYYASFENFTDYLEHLPELNYIENEFSNVSYYVNQTLEYINFTIFKDVFVDYLTYILYPFKGNETEIAVLNISNINSSEITDSSFVGDSFSVFRLAMISLFGNISNYFNDTMEKEILNIYNNISTTVTSILENKTLYSTDSTNVSTKIVTAQITTESSYSPTTLVIPVKGNYTMCARLRALCWETMFGQELIKLTVMDLIMTILSTLAIDFFRGIFVRVMNRCWCWDLEKKFPQYGDFKVAENILHLVNNQGMVWMGMFFSPGLVVLNIIKLHIMMYFRAWAVLTCNVPPEVIFRASRSNNFYYALLLMMLFLCVLPVGYTIVWIKPSFHCGPFSRYQKIFHIFTETVRNTVPETFQKALDYIASPGIVIPLLVLLTLIIYYLISLTGALREANEDLKIQLHRERTEERRKMFQIVDRRRGGSGESNELSNTPYAKWNKLLVALPNAKSFDDTAKQVSEEIPQSKTNGKVENKSKDFFTKFIKKALGKSSTSDEEQNMEDATDTEQHESLPYDPTLTNQHRTVKSSLSWGNSNISHATASTEFSRNGGRVDSFPSESTDSFEIKPNDNRSTTSKYSTIGHYTFDFNKGQQHHKTSGDPMPSTSKYVRQDSGSSVWSDNIPVITISKVSAENKLEDNTETHLGKNKLNIKLSEQRKLKANVECPLKKQSSTIDEDIMCDANIERATNIPEKKIIKAVAEEDSGNGTVSGNSRFEDLSDMSDISNKNLEILEDISTDKSSSEDTAYKDSSIDTIFQSPHVNKDT